MLTGKVLKLWDTMLVIDVIHLWDTKYILKIMKKKILTFYAVYDKTKKTQLMKNKEQIWVQMRACNNVFYTKTYI